MAPSTHVPLSEPRYVDRGPPLRAGREVHLCMVARDGHVVQEDAVARVAAKSDDGRVELERLTNLGTLDNGQRGVGRLLLGHEVWNGSICRGHAENVRCPMSVAWLLVGCIDSPLE